jgi:iron complex outermembrane receptor protein
MKKNNTTCLRAVAVAFLAGLLGFTPAVYARAADLQSTHKFSIPAQSLDTALLAFSDQAKVQVLMQGGAKADAHSSGAIGELISLDALTAILRNTGFGYQQIGRETVAIVPAGSQSSATSMNANQELRPIRVSLSGPPSSQDAEQNQSSTENTQNSQNQSTGPLSELDEVVVTGTHIRGVRNDSSPMLTVDREYIERSGFTNMMQLVESLPIDFKGGGSGSSETAAFGITQTSQNLTRGTGFNLHGLGSVSTLTLINGRRVASSAQGQFVDVSNIPLAAVERVEILTDGASAIYGADAVAGVVNIILRKNFDGAETSASYGQANSGRVREGRLSQTFGKSWGTGDTLVVADLHQRDPLDGRDRSYIAAAGGAPSSGPTYILPDRTAGSLLFNYDQTLPAGFDLASNILYSHERVIQKQTFSDGTFYTNHPVSNQESGNVSLGYKGFGDWRFELDGAIARLETVTDLTAIDITTGRIEQLINDYRDRFDTWETDIRGDGSLFSLPAGNVRLATGVSYRNDRVNSTRQRVIPRRRFQVRARDKRHDTSAYTELFIPFVGKTQEIPGARRIEMSIAARYDDYSDFGSTVNPKVGIVWSPVDMLDLRATYGTSFRAPTVAEKALGTRGQIFTSTLDSPGGGTVPIFGLLGGTPLTAEKSRDLAVGFTLRPLPRGQITFSWYKIDYRNRISQPPYIPDALLHPEVYGNLISPILNDAAAQAYLDQRVADGDTYADFLGTGAQGVRYVFDLREQNAARTRTSGFDVTATYPIVVKNETIDLNVSLARINKILDSLTATTTAINEVNTFEQPLKTRVRAMATWVHGSFNTTVAMNYSNSYTDTEAFPHVPVSSWITTDLVIGYSFEHSSDSFLRGTKASLSITNLFNREPPLAPDPLFNTGYDVYNGDALGRYVSVRLSKKW